MSVRNIYVALCIFHGWNCVSVAKHYRTEISINREIIIFCQIDNNIFQINLTSKSKLILEIFTTSFFLYPVLVTQDEKSTISCRAELIWKYYLRFWHSMVKFRCEIVPREVNISNFNYHHFGINICRNNTEFSALSDSFENCLRLQLHIKLWNVLPILFILR